MCYECKDSSFTMSDDKASCSCDPGKLYNSGTKVCDDCNSECKLCETTVDKCTECDITRKLIKDGDTCVCTSGYIYLSDECKKCNDVCFSCVTD